MLDSNVVFNLHKGEAMAAEVAASSPDRRCWICVYPYKKHHPETAPKEQHWMYRVRWFEVDKSILAERNNDLDGDEDFIVVRGDVWVATPEELEDALSQWVANDVQLSYPYVCEYPC